MERLDRWSALFWFGISAAVCVHSVNLGVGSFREPVSVFCFSGAACSWGLSLVLLIESWKAKETEQGPLGVLSRGQLAEGGGGFFGLVVYASFLNGREPGLHGHLHRLFNADHRGEKMVCCDLCFRGFEFLDLYPLQSPSKCQASLLVLRVLTALLTSRP